MAEIPNNVLRYVIPKQKKHTKLKIIRALSHFHPLLHPSLLLLSQNRGLADARYERRKAAALEIETVTRRLHAAGHTEKVGAIIRRLGEEFAFSPEPNHRKGGLIGLAALAVGLGQTGAEEYLQDILPPVLHSFVDQVGAAVSDLAPFVRKRLWKQTRNLYSLLYAY